MAYFAEIANGKVTGTPDNPGRGVIVAPDIQWCIDNHGGTWVETADPYSTEPQTIAYCGPGYTVDLTFPERFAPEWIAPTPDLDTGIWSSYRRGAVVAHNGQLWKSTIDNNVWEPGVSAWHPQPDIAGVLPNWIQPTGAHDAWPLGAEVTHVGKSWRSLVAANVWEPGTNATLWQDLSPVVLGPWKSGTVYNIGDRVTFRGSTYESIINNNVWSPSAYPQGWKVV